MEARLARAAGLEIERQIAPFQPLPQGRPSGGTPGRGDRASSRCRNYGPQRNSRSLRHRGGGAAMGFNPGCRRSQLGGEPPVYVLIVHRIAEQTLAASEAECHV
jgi:hypothetical protein